MLPAFLITLREVIEATLIVATIIGILTKLKQTENIKTAVLATALAVMVSIFLLGLGSFFGVKIQELYTGKTEELFEGVMMITSAFFITWAVFWLHTYFARHKLKLLQQVRSTIEENSKYALFVLVFTAVFREGFEIVLFLSTIYLSESPSQVFMGFGLGSIAGLFVAFLLFTATVKLPVYRAFQVTTVLLILFAAGLLARGVHELAEAGIIPEAARVTIAFLPASGTFAADLVKSLFGLTKHMDYLGLSFYATYIAIMRWFIYTRKKSLLPRG